MIKVRDHHVVHSLIMMIKVRDHHWPLIVMIKVRDHHFVHGLS